ncbi:FtsW/RodA/SpoVE family cell cycle protein [Treponema sp. C6A8]|uniref:FtsW/RodA/SpoVE family cell cycle protein n=1 Tax=Treponema sp. C6A8 TaxID=1410609 RepID=UPI0009DD6B10|nr:putative peptidoglycan glycosyltransferase FtsW [Treponema sp. C6A8]
MESFTFYANKPSENYHKVDMLLFVSMILLWGLGVFSIFICSQRLGSNRFGNPYYFVNRHLICSLAGFVLFMFFLVSDMSFVRKLVFLIVLFSIISCIFTYFPGISIEKNGARRWLKMPMNFTFQPSELMKFALVLFVANYFEKQEEILDEDEKTVFPCVVGFFVFVGCVMAQKDFSTGVFLAIIGILMFFVSGTKLRWLFPFMFVAIPAVILLITLEQYRMERIIGFLRPDEFASSVNYQTLAAKRAISAGGFWGNGIGSGLSKINSIPEVQADYIFAGWSEAMGFCGVLAYFVLLCVFAWRGYLAAFNSPSRFTGYASFGCVSIIFIQSIINCMVVCGLLPSTGIPLPFFSLGGSSIIVTLAMCGFILNASRADEGIVKEKKYEEISLNTFSVLK